jgi:uncharacterized protein YndB with AHSA1/START domain
MSDLNSRTLTIKKTLNAPIQVVWDAWTQAEQIAKWWGPKGMTTKIDKQDLKVGGEWKFTMKMPDGSDFIAEGIYEVIEAPFKLVTSANFRPMTEGVQMEILLDEDGDATHFTFNVIHISEEYCKAQEKMGFYNGWGSTFERLKELVEA